MKYRIARETPPLWLFILRPNPMPTGQFLTLLSPTGKQPHYKLFTTAEYDLPDTGSRFSRVNRRRLITGLPDCNHLLGAHAAGFIWIQP